MVAADGNEASPADLNALALRLLGWLTLLGGGLLLLMLTGLLRLPHASQGGQAGFVLPGTSGRHLIGAEVVPILAGSGGVLALIGLVALWLGRHAPTHRLTFRRATPRLRRPILILLGGLAVLAAVLLRR